MDIRKEAELRVLRNLKNKGKEIIPNGMDEHEFKAACYRLKDKGCVRLALIEGGGIESIRMLDEGFVYLKELEIELIREMSELNRLQNENAKLKSIIKKTEHRHILFEKTQEFVNDTRYLYNIIMHELFYDRNDHFYQQTMEKFNLYCNVNEDELVKEVNCSPLQTFFDDYKKLLNSIVIPNMDTMNMSWFIQKNLTSDRSLLEDAIEIFETVVEKCGNLRNSVDNFMELYDLKDNFPIKGFLRPLYYDGATSKDIQNDVSALTNIDDDDNDPKTWDEHEFDGIEPYRIDFTGRKCNTVISQIHQFLIDRKIIHKEIKLIYFTACVRKAKYGRIYNSSKSHHKLIFVAKKIAKSSHDEDKYRKDSALSMGYEDIKKWEKVSTDDTKFKEELNKIF